MLLMSLRSKKRKGFISVAYHQGKVFSGFCKKKVYEVVKQVKNPQEQNCLQNQRFEAYEQALRVNEVFCHFKFLKELSEGHQTDMSEKCKRIGKNHLFKKTFLKLRLQFLMPQKHSDKLYSKCCKVFKAYLTSRTVNFVLTHSS